MIVSHMAKHEHDLSGLFHALADPTRRAMLARLAQGPAAVTALAGPTGLRLPTVLRNTSGFVYYVSITGITGAAIPDYSKVASAVARIKGHTSLPVAVGFGVKNAQTAAAIAAHADGVVVGTALIDALKASLDADNRATAGTVSAVTRLVADIAGGVKSARRSA